MQIINWHHLFGSCTTKKVSIWCKLVLFHQYLEVQIIVLSNF